VLDVLRWAEIRRMREVDGLSIREIARRTGHDRNTVRRALRGSVPPCYERPSRPSKLDPFEAEIHRLLGDDAAIPGKRILEILEGLGYEGSKTILYDYLREIRPHFLEARTYQRTRYRPGELVQFDLWEPSREVPVGWGQTRRGFVVVGLAPWSRAGAGALVFSRQAPDLCFGMARCLGTLGGLPERLVWDREGALCAGEGRPTDAYAAFCGQLPVGWVFCRPRDAEAKGAVERLQQYLESSFEPGRRFAGEADFQAQLDGWFRERANARLHRVIRAVPAERLAEERERMRPLPDPPPDTDRRFTLRVPPQPYVRVDTNDYSLDPRLAGRRVEVTVTQSEIRAVALDTGELCASHRRVFARHLTLTDPAHQAELERLRGHRRREPEVELRPLARYDRLIPA
jgi:transposase